MKDLMADNASPYFRDTFSFFQGDRKRYVTSALACVLGVIVLIVYFQMGPTPESYARAEESVAKWEKSGDAIAYQEMRQALKKAPALESKYAAMIAQRLFEQDRLSEALQFAHGSLKHLETEAPFHASYGETSILIEKGSYQDALERSVVLREAMKNSFDFAKTVGGHPVGGALLFAHNLLRIAYLQKELNNKPGEKAAWEELETFLQGKEVLESRVFQAFRDKGLNLIEYIQERKRLLCATHP